jgi:hypothetical protein
MLPNNKYYVAMVVGSETEKATESFWVGWESKQKDDLFFEQWFDQMSIWNIYGVTNPTPFY